jgi:hypothetical protein
MRCSTGTNFGFDWSVVVCTNSTIAFLAGPSFHDPRGLDCASAGAQAAESSATRSAHLDRSELSALTTNPPVSVRARAVRHRLHHPVQAEAGRLLARRELAEGLQPVRHERLRGYE